MPLRAEVYHAQKQAWIQFGFLEPGDSPASFSDNTGGQRYIYVARCTPDDFTSAIYSSRFGVDVADAQLRRLDTTGMDLVKELRRGDPPYEMVVQPDKSPEPRCLRFTHL